MNLSFEQMYQQLSEKHRPQLEKIQRSIARKLWIAGILCVGVAILLLVLLPASEFPIYLIVCMPIAFCVYRHFLKRPYVLYFRENVAKSFVRLMDSNLSYSPEPSGTENIRIMDNYYTAKFDGRTILGDARRMVQVTTMGSPGLSNLITGEIEARPFRLCCMSLQGSGNDKTKFKGLFVSMKVSKSLNGFIKVGRKVGLPGFNQRYIPRAERKKMDHGVFEKDFFVGSDDQITAMQYLTADIMELFLDFKNELIDIQTRFNRDLWPQNPSRISLDLFWQGDEVLMRIGNKKMFKPTMRDPMCKDSLACCLSSLAFATRFNQVVTKSIKDTAI